MQRFVLWDCINKNQQPISKNILICYSKFDYISFESVFYDVFYLSSKKQVFFCFLLYLHFLITVLKFYSSNSGPQQSGINSHALLKGIRLFTSVCSRLVKLPYFLLIILFLCFLFWSMCSKCFASGSSKTVLKSYQQTTFIYSDRLHVFLAMLYCNSMPFGAACAYYGKVLVLASAASWNGRVCGEVK